MNQNATNPNLILIGYRACGKTTLGRFFAEAHDMPFFDSDDRIELHAEMSIAEIFARHGEKTFRDSEEREIAALLTEAAEKRQAIVLSPGGGAILRETTRKRLRESGCVVWLQADADTILGRLEGDSGTESRRPALTALPPRKEIEHLLQARESYYRETSHFLLDTNSRSHEELLEDIKILYRRFCV